MVASQGIITWDQFSSELISTLKLVNSVKIARDKLAVLGQVASISKDNFEFTQLILEVNNINESEKLDKYIVVLSVVVSSATGITSTLYENTRKPKKAKTHNDIIKQNVDKLFILGKTTLCTN